MATIVCAFTIPNASANSNGSRLTGAGFTSSAPLQSGDKLQVVVRAAGQNAPSSLRGYAIVSPAPDAPAQNTPSPFVNASTGKFVCFGDLGVATKTGDGAGTTIFTFSAVVYSGSQAGKYELTFVAEDPSTGTQWSEDPEFETEG